MSLTPSRKSALDAATLERCGPVPCSCPDDWRVDTPARTARCPSHGSDLAREGWFEERRERTRVVVDSYLEALGAAA